jgi:hypothetical protein
MSICRMADRIGCLFRRLVPQDEKGGSEGYQGLDRVIIARVSQSQNPVDSTRPNRRGYSRITITPRVHMQVRLRKLSGYLLWEEEYHAALGGVSRIERNRKEKKRWAK